MALPLRGYTVLYVSVYTLSHFPLFLSLLFFFETQYPESILTGYEKCSGQALLQSLPPKVCHPAVFILVPWTLALLARPGKDGLFCESGESMELLDQESIQPFAGPAHIHSLPGFMGRCIFIAVLCSLHPFHRNPAFLSFCSTWKTQTIHVTQVMSIKPQKNLGIQREEFLKVSMAIVFGARDSANRHTHSWLCLRVRGEGDDVHTPVQGPQKGHGSTWSPAVSPFCLVNITQGATLPFLREPPPSSLECFSWTVLPRVMDVGPQGT